MLIQFISHDQNEAKDVSNNILGVCVSACAGVRNDG